MEIFSEKTLSLSTGIDDSFNKEGLIRFLNEEQHVSSYQESPILRYLYSVFPHVESRGKTEAGDLYFCDMTSGKLYVLPRNGWSHNFNRWFDRQRATSEHVMRDDCITRLKKNY